MRLNESKAYCLPNVGTCMLGKSLQLCLILCDPMDCSPTGSSVHEILHAEILGGLPFPTPGDLPDPEPEPTSLVSPAGATEALEVGRRRV